MFDLLAPFRASTGGYQPAGSTVERVRINVSQTLFLSAANVLDNLDLASTQMGLIVDQIQGDFAQVPRPLVEPHADWMAWNRMPVTPTFGSTLTVATDLATATRVTSAHEFDVKSTRRMDELGETLYLVFQLNRADPTDSSVSGTASVLLKLP